MKKAAQYKLLERNLSAVLSLVLPLFLVLTQGCGTASRVNTLPTLTNKTILSENQGIVIARVINASGNPLPFNQLTLTPDNINESDKIKWQELQSLNPQMNGSTIFGAPVKAGAYSLNSISTYYSNGAYWYSRFARADPKFGTFEVKPNQVTDLGTIIYYTKPQDDRYLELLVHLPEAELGEVLDKYFSFYTYDKNNILGWTEDGLEDERESLFLSVAQNPITFNKTYLSPDKSLYFLGNFGMVVKRTNFGDWELDAVDSNLKINAIAENKSGDLAIGGGEGRLFWKRLGTQWQDISLGHEYQIVDLAFYDEKTLTMLAKNKTELLVLTTTTDSDTFEWQEINRYDSIKGWKNSDITPTDTKRKNPKPVKRISSVSLSKIGDQDYVRIATRKIDAGPVFSETIQNMYKFDQKNWFVSKLENELEVTAAIDAGATKLGLKEPGFWSWSGATTYYRYIERSDSWDKINTQVVKCSDGNLITEKGCANKKSKSKQKKQSFNFRSVPWFKDELQAIAIVSFSDFDFWSGERSKETKIISTADGGKSWIDTGNELPKEYCSHLVTQVSDRLLVGCQGASGDFFESTDGGKNWNHVRQQENF